MPRLPFLLVCLAMTACQRPTPRPELLVFEVKEALVLHGPGMVPQPGTPPFQPPFSARLALHQPLPAGATVWVKLMEPEAVEAWRARGARDAVQATVEPLESGAMRIQAALRPGSVPRNPQAGVEIRLGDRVLGRATAAAAEQYLPTPPPGGGRDLRRERP